MNKRTKASSKNVCYLEVLPGAWERSRGSWHLRAVASFTFIRRGARMSPFKASSEPVAVPALGRRLVWQPQLVGRLFLYDLQAENSFYIFKSSR